MCFKRTAVGGKQTPYTFHQGASVTSSSSLAIRYATIHCCYNISWNAFSKYRVCMHTQGTYTWTGAFDEIGLSLQKYRKSVFLQQNGRWKATKIISFSRSNSNEF